MAFLERTAKTWRTGSGAVPFSWCELDVAFRSPGDGLRQEGECGQWEVVYSEQDKDGPSRVGSMYSLDGTFDLSCELYGRAPGNADDIFIFRLTGTAGEVHRVFLHGNLSFSMLKSVCVPGGEGAESSSLRLCEFGCTSISCRGRVESCAGEMTVYTENAGDVRLQPGQAFGAEVVTEKVPGVFLPVAVVWVYGSGGVRFAHNTRVRTRSVSASAGLPRGALVSPFLAQIR